MELYFVLLVFVVRKHFISHNYIFLRLLSVKRVFKRKFKGCIVSTQGYQHNSYFLTLLQKKKKNNNNIE